MLLLGGVGTSSTAVAHPFGAALAAHRVDVHVAPEGVVVDYRAEVPITVIVANARSAPVDPDDRMAEDLAAGLVLAVDGETVPLKALSPPEIGRDGEHTHSFRLTLGTLKSPSASLAVSNGNLPEVESWCSTRLTVAPGFEVGEVQALPRAAELEGAWLPCEGARGVTVALTPATSALDRAWYGWVDPDRARRPAMEARPATSWRERLARSMDPPLGLALLAATTLGAFLGAPSRRRLALESLAGLALVALTVVAPTWGTLALLATAAVLTPLLASRTPPSVVAWLALAAAVEPPRLRLGLAALALVLALARRRAPAAPLPLQRLGGAMAVFPLVVRLWALRA